MSPPPQELVELVEFLASPKPDVRKEAVALVEGLSGSDAGCATLGQVAPTLLPALLGMLWGHGPEARAAATALANLSRHPDLVPVLLSKGAVGHAISGVKHPVCGHKSVLLALLANVSALGGAPAAVELAAHVPALAAFLDASKKPEAAEAAGHAASILCNCTQAAAGRAAVLAREPGPRYAVLRALLAQLASPAAACRLWAMSALKNLCMEAESRAALLEAAAGAGAAVAVLPALLLPLSGAKPREGDATVRRGGAGGRAAGRLQARFECITNAHMHCRL